MKKALFYTFLSVLGVTAVVTLLGITQYLQIQEGYLDKLFYMLIAELIAPVIVLFTKTKFFDDATQDALQIEVPKLSVVIIPKESFSRKGDPHKCTVRVYSLESDEEREINIIPKRRNGYLSAFLEKVSEHELIKVSVSNSSDEQWESEYFKPSETKAEMVKI